MKKKIVLGLMVSFFFLLVGTSYSAETDEINAAIYAKGGKWIAGETSVSNLPIELKQKLSGLKYDTSEKLQGHVVSGRPKSGAASSSLGTSSSPSCLTTDSVCDWTNRSGHSYVTKVKNQGNCGSCWAFASTAVLESESLISFNMPGLSLDLSEQIMLSCTNPSRDNCENGGYPSDAGNFLMSSGTNLETCYPYTATDGYCANACSNYSINPSSNYYIYNWYATNPTASASTLDAAIQNMKNLLYLGPVVGTMDVYDDFYSYRSGVYSYVYGYYDGSHAIEIVGWNDDLQAFHVKNSWGTGWGENGYFWISYYELFGTTYFAYYSYFFEGGKHTPTVNFSSVPSGLQISSNGGSYYTPVQLEFETGSSDTVATPVYQGVGNCNLYKYSHWTGSGKVTQDSQNAYITFTEPLTGGETFTANFKENVVPSFQVTPSGAGNITWKPFDSNAPGPYFSPNSSATLTAVPSPGYAFIGWTGSVMSAKNPVSVKMTQVGPSGPCQVVTANFASFSLTQPVGGETLTSGAYQIGWSEADASGQIPLTYGVFYSTNGTTWKAIATGLSSTSYSWTVPSVTKPTSAYVKVVCYNGKTDVHELKSGAFTITTK